MKYYAISQNDNEKVTQTFPNEKYANDWFACPTNKQFIADNDTLIVSADHLNDIK